RDERIDWEGLTASAETLVVMMGTRWLDDIAQRVIAGGRDPSTPVAVIEEGTTPRQRVVVAPLGAVAESVRRAGLRAPTTIVIGEVARLRDTLAWYERRPLFGRRVLVTRAHGQSAELQVALLARGAEPVCVPLLEFATPRDPEPLERALAQRERFEWIVFASANAVRATAERLRGGAARIACIGPATARAARAAGLAPTFEPSSRALPETLVARLQSLGSLEGARVLLPRADRAREALAEALAAAGARVTAVEAYRSVTPEGAGPRLAAALRAGVDAVLLASPSAVHAFLDLGGSASGGPVLACIGPTTARALRERGHEPQVVAEHQTGEDWVSALEGYFAEESDAVS
ncbi:MAG: uroporphyrinogen-III synthase, partial [Myxococcota bacterium]